MTALALPVLAYAGYKDHRYRLIPDRVHILLFLIGFIDLLPWGSIFYVSISDRIMGGLIPFIVLFFIYIFYDRARDQIGGGDYKLLISTGFCMGLNALVMILCATSVLGGFRCLIKKERKIPLAVYMFFATVINFIFIIALWAMD